MKLVAAILLTVLLLPVLASAQSYPSPQDKYVNDFAGFLDSATVSQLRSMLSALEQNTTAEVVVVTVQTTEPLVPSQYRTELFNKWGVGKAGNDNGLLVLYAVKENRIEVEVGYGLEGILPDSKVGRILDDFYVPYRDSNQTAAGIALATQELARVINENADEVRSGNAGPSQPGPFDLIANLAPFIVFAVFFAIIPFAARASAPKCKTCGERMKYLRAEGNYDVFECKNGHTTKRKRRRTSAFIIAGGLGGSGGGFGGGGFGGGGSGGGGAGR